jgi:hypothetical protein
VTSSWFFLSTLNYDARSTTHQIIIIIIIIIIKCGVYEEEEWCLDGFGKETRKKQTAWNV